MWNIESIASTTHGGRTRGAVLATAAFIAMCALLLVGAPSASGQAGPAPGRCSGARTATSGQPGRVFFPCANGSSNTAPETVQRAAMVCLVDKERCQVGLRPLVVAAPTVRLPPSGAGQHEVTPDATALMCRRGVTTDSSDLWTS
jgi:hypothetical protein